MDMALRPIPPSPSPNLVPLSPGNRMLNIRPLHPTLASHLAESITWSLGESRVVD